jgi:hypothetical protein
MIPNTNTSHVPIITPTVNIVNETRSNQGKIWDF